MYESQDQILVLTVFYVPSSLDSGLILKSVRRERCPTRAATGVPRSLETTPPWDPTVGICLGPCGGPRGGRLFLRSEVPLYMLQKSGEEKSVQYAIH